MKSTKWWNTFTWDFSPSEIDEINYQQLPSAISIGYCSLRPIKINSEEILFIQYGIGPDHVLDVYALQTIRMTKYNINSNQWQKRQIMLNENVDWNKESSANIEESDSLPRIHDIAYDNKRTKLCMIDNRGELWIINTSNNEVKSIRLDSQYGFWDFNDPKLIIIDNNLYVLAPDCNDGRYVIDISNDEYPITRLGLSNLHTIDINNTHQLKSIIFKYHN